MSEKLYTLKEVAQYLSVDEKEIQRLVDDGVIPAYKIGGSFIRFRKEQLDAIKDEITSRVEKDKNESPVLAEPVIAEKLELPPRKETFLEKVKDFFYFHDFFIICTAIIAVLLYIIYTM